MRCATPNSSFYRTMPIQRPSDFCQMFPLSNNSRFILSTSYFWQPQQYHKQWSLSSKTPDKIQGKILWKTNDFYTSHFHSAPTFGLYSGQCSFGKNPHSSALVKLWRFLHFGSHIAATEKTIPERVVENKVGQRSKTTENACVKCGIVYHNGFTTRTRNARLSGQNLLKRLAIPRFYQENILTNTRVAVLLYFLQVTRVHLQRSYI